VPVHTRPYSGTRPPAVEILSEKGALKIRHFFDGRLLLHPRRLLRVLHHHVLTRTHLTASRSDRGHAGARSLVVQLSQRSQFADTTPLLFLRAGDLPRYCHSLLVTLTLTLP
jgi:hypothetical protein